MCEKEVIKQLNQNNNFHLALKCVQITDDKIIKEIIKNDKNKKIVEITSLENAYEKLLKAYNDKVDLVLVNENIKFVLPQLVILTKEETSLITPLIPTYYLIKDNKIIQKIKTICHKKESSFFQLKNEKEIEDLIKKI